MPLSMGAKKSAIKRNIKKEMASRKPQKQAVAIALSMAEKGKKSKSKSKSKKDKR